MRPELNPDDPIHHDNPGVTWTAPDGASHRDPPLNPEDYMEAVEEQKDRDN